MADVDRGHLPQLRHYSGGRNLEIVSGKIYSANHPYIVKSLPPPPPRSPDPTPYWSKYDLDHDRRVGKRTTASSGGGSTWCFGDPEMKRRKRVASYKAYSVEGKLKAKLQRGFRWFKDRCHELVHGY